ncbi:MAG: chemotaxis protein CheA [Myxococcales bacterium]|nr:chemotaxis protein CheA [Myxococcales bacterium]
MFDNPEDRLELVTEFVIESREMIDAIEGVLINLEAHEDPSEPLNEAFRCFHSIKGLAGFLGFGNLTRLTHEAESLLTALRQGDIALTRELVDVLCVAIDTMVQIIAVIEETQSDETTAKLCIPTVEALNAAYRNAMGFTDAPPQEDAPQEGVLLQKPDTFVLDAEDASEDEGEPEEPGEPGEPEDEDEDEGGPEQDDEGHEPSASPTARPESARASKSAGKLKGASRSVVRVDLGKLDELMNLVGELIIAEAAVKHSPDLLGLELEDFFKSVSHLNRITRDLQDISMSMRMVPIASVFRKALRAARDVSQRQRKEVKVEIEGEDTEVDKGIVELLSDPLVHMIRNAIDHGLERPEERVKAGKRPEGRVRLTAHHQGSEVWVCVADDGRGLNRDKILARARERDLIAGRGEEMSDTEVFELVFHPGFSTNDEVTDISGRGVGMDVVRRNVERFKGKIDIASELGKGTTFTMRIPLTLAIMEGMQIRVGQERFIIPLLSIQETLRARADQVTRMPSGHELLTLRERSVPLLRLYEQHDLEPDSRRVEEGIVLVLEADGIQFALLVDEVIGQLQTVIKSLGDYLKSTPGLSGCTILGDGAVSLILDVSAMRQSIRDRARAPHNTAAMAS